jgi:hypothetical protein
VRIIITARARLDEPAVNAEVGVEMNGHAIGKLVASPTVASDSDMTIPAAAVGRILRAGYNRLTFVSYGVHPIDAASAGPLPAPRTRDRAWPVAIYRIRIAPD